MVGCFGVCWSVWWWCQKWCGGCEVGGWLWSGNFLDLVVVGWSVVGGSRVVVVV